MPTLLSWTTRGKQKPRNWRVEMRLQAERRLMVAWEPVPGLPGPGSWGCPPGVLAQAGKEGVAQTASSVL